MSEATTESPTAEDLQRRVEELRRQQGIDPKGGTRSAQTSTAKSVEDSYFEQVEKRAMCGCGQAFSYMTLAGVTSRRSTCDACIDKERLAEQDAEKRVETERRQKDQANRSAKLLELIENAGANPWEHGSATLANFDRSEAGDMPVRYARKFVADVKAATRYDPVKGLYLHGPTGTGKTHLAVAVLREIVTDTAFNPSAVVYDHALELMARIQNTYGGNGDTFALLERRIDAGLWILDDLGTERASDDVSKHLTLIFTRRAMRPTLVTSNYSPADLDEKRPELMRVLSRLGPAYFRTAAVGGRDRRFG